MGDDKQTPAPVGGQPNMFEVLAAEAERKANSGQSCFGIKYEDGVIIAGLKQKRSKIHEIDTVEKVYEISDTMCIGYSGVMADGVALVKNARYSVQNHILKFGEEPSVEKIAEDLSNVMRHYASTSGVKPFGVKMLVGGYDEEPRLFESTLKGIEGNGEYLAKAIGVYSEKIDEHFDANYKKGIAKKDAEDLAFEALAMIEDFKAEEATKSGKSFTALTADEIDFAYVTTNGFERAEKSFVATALTEAKAKRRKA
ncbi:MAG: hypothetical protein HZB68_01900 [Candidatus Aenigmarchaeota archaeon]|nr:hypothetical protein [Candidatus Aenigmarchaeota archaeon]